MKKTIFVFIILYLLSYGLFRTLRSEVWAEDNNTYVIYPSSPIALYYAYRPLAYIDGLVTGVGTHVGPHR